MDERPDSSQQLMDILLVMDEKGTLQAVSGVKDGELQTKNPLEDNNDLLRVDRHGDMFSNFFSNLWSQLKDPTRFHFFRVPEEEVQRVAADFRQRESQSVKTGEPLVAQYEVQPPVQAQQQTQAGQQQQPEGAPQQSAGQTEQNPQYKYRPEDIDWNSLAALGVQREQIEGNGMLDQMLRGFQTDKTVRVHFHFDGISHSNDSQLSLKPGTNGRLTVCSHGILDPEKMQKQFFGYDITDSDKQVLRQTGNMGHPATVTNRAGEQVEALVSRNLKTNELVAFPLSKVNIPAEKNGHTFTPDEIARLKQGEAVVCRFLSRAKEGEQPKIYPAPVQFSAAKMQLEFLFGDRGRLAMDAYKANLKQTANQEVPKTFRKQELTEKSRLELEAGGTVKVSGLVDKKGKAYQGLHHMEARREARLHVPQGLQCGARRGACQARRGERGAGGGQFRGQDRRDDPQPERSPAIRTAATYRGTETAAGAERGPETGTEAGAARQAQAQPGCPPLISPAIL